MTTRTRSSRRLALLVATLATTVGIPATSHAQWSTAYEQFYLPGKFNWMFRNTYPAADRLFNAFDYGHAILYERLYNDPTANPSTLEQTEYDFITRKLLVNPPRVPLEESAIEVNYAKLAPEAKMMFDWAHLLHRQIYDVLASEGMAPGEKDAKVAELVRYYKTRPDLAFSSVPKNMDLMEGQPYSLVFRQRYPKFNGLIWGYHWLQIGLYEPLLAGTTFEERQAGVSAAVSRFRQMLENAPEHMPSMMPMTAAVAPTFAKRYPEAAIIFDNLHSMHDVVSDILASPNVPRGQKRAEILRAASRYRDATSFAMTQQEWMDMAQMMGIENMGGPSVGVLSGWPTPTIARGTPAAEAMKAMASMQHGSAGTMAGMGHSAMPGMKMDSATKPGSMTGMSMPGMKMDSTAKPDTTMAGMHMPGMPPAGADPMMEAFMRLASDSVVRRHLERDTVLRRAFNSVIDAMPADHREQMKAMMPDNAAGMDMSGMKMSGMNMPGMTMTQKATKPATRAATPATKTASPKTPVKTATKTATKTKAVPAKPAAKAPPPKKTDPMAGMPGMANMPGMTPPPKKKPPIQ